MSYFIHKQRSPLTKQTSVHQAKVSSWLHSSEDMDKCSRGQCHFPPRSAPVSSRRLGLFILRQISPFFFKDLEECESYLLELNLLLKSMEVLHRTYSAPAIGALQVKTDTQLAVMLNVETLCSIHTFTRSGTRFSLATFTLLLHLCSLLSRETQIDKTCYNTT